MIGPNGARFVGRAAANTPTQACRVAESELYHLIATHLGGSVAVRTRVLESEVSGEMPFSQQSTAFDMLTQFNLNNEVKKSRHFEKTGHDWRCIHEATFTTGQLADLESEQKEKYEKQLQRKRDRNFIIDVGQQHPVVEKIKTLNRYLGQTNGLSSEFDTTKLAASYLSQIQISPTLSISTNGSDTSVLTLDVHDLQGCLDGLFATAILPSGRFSKGVVLGCDKLNLEIPRPAYPGKYTLPIMFTYSGLSMGPVEVILEATGHPRQASGFFHPFIEAQGRADGIGKMSLDEARALSRKELYAKSSQLEGAQLGLVTEQIVINSNSVAVKLKGRIQ